MFLSSGDPRLQSNSRSQKKKEKKKKYLYHVIKAIVSWIRLTPCSYASSIWNGLHLGHQLLLSSGTPILAGLMPHLGARRTLYSHNSSLFLLASTLPSLSRIESTKLILSMVNSVLQRGMSKFHHASVIQINSTQSGPLASHQALCVLSALLTVGWFFRAHVHGCKVSEASLKLARMAAQHCRNQASTPAKDTHCSWWTLKGDT